ncbi:MAG: hypothetical protein KGJ78_10005 [Alphaproteobacteria bacterium]|nr:hypothetical protein [Alphaproteobacteria bacterium]
MWNCVLFRALRTAALAVAFLWSAAWAGDLNSIGSYANNGVETNIFTYKEGDTVVALIGMHQGDLRISYAFAKSDWPDFERLWNAARSAGGSSKFVAAGSVPETGTKAKCVITAAGGPNVRLIIVDPSEGAILFDLPPGVEGDFDAKLRQAAAQLTD